MKKKALITGITGQDGSYLAEFLLSKGYEVHGIIRRASNFNTQRIEHIYQDPHVINRSLFLHYGDVTDFGAVSALIHQLKPDEIYNMAAQSHVRLSFQMPEYTGLITGLGTTCMLDAIKKVDVMLNFIRLHLQKCLVLLNHLRMKILHFTRGVPMLQQKSMLIG